MVSSTIIKHEMSCGLMPTATPSTTPAAGIMIENTNHSQQQQQQQILKSQQINSPKMGSRRIFTPQFKLQVLESYRNDNDCKGNQRATARKYNIHRRQIQKWLQCESNLRSSVANLNQSQVKHQFHNITPNTTVTSTTPTMIVTSTHNSQFVSQQHQQQQHYQHQLKQTMNSSHTVPSTPTATPTAPCTAAGALVAANFAAAVAAAVDKHCSTATTTSLAPIRPTAIVGSSTGDEVNSPPAGAYLPHLQHHLTPHHHHHHHHHVHPHAHAHHHHPYYTHSAVPILTHHQPLYPHPAAAALLAAAHHHLPPHQIPNAAVLHHHHYQQQQQQQHEYHNLQQQQQHQQLFATNITDSVADKEPLEVEVVEDADTNFLKSENSIDYEREQFEFENAKNGNRVRLTAVYKLQQQQQEQDEETEKQNSIAITPIDLSLTGARRNTNNHNNNNHQQNHKILMTKEETVQKYDKYVPYDDDVINNQNSQETTNNAALVVDLTFRKRKVMSKCTLETQTTQTTENVTASSSTSRTAVLVMANDDAQPEKMPKFSTHQSMNASVSSNGIKIKQEHVLTHDTTTTAATTAATTTNTNTTSSAQNAISKPVKLFKPYLLHEEEEEHKERQQEEEKFHKQQLLTTSPQAVPVHTETFQVVNSKYSSTFPNGSAYFQNSNDGSKPTSPKSVLCSPTSPVGFQRFSKGSPVSGYESSSSTYSECSSHRGYSFDLHLRAVYSEQLASPPHLQQHQQLLATTTQHHFQGWLDQDTQSSLATCSTRSSPTPTPTPPTTRTPPAANTSIALYA